jgi:outer membrane scaffolding protein for murein synthesis (MipA/OmpV family)
MGVLLTFKISSNSRIFAAVSQFIMLITTYSQAETSPNLAAAAPVHTVPLWEFGIGLSAARLDVYPGATDVYNAAVPFPYFVYRGKFLNVDREAVRGVFVNTPRFRLQVSMAGTLPVPSTRSRQRIGMPNLPPLLSIGPDFRFSILGDLDTNGLLSFSLPAQAALAGRFPTASYEGWVIAPELRWQRHVMTNMTDYNDQQLTVGMLYADSLLNNFYYGVDNQWAQEGRSAYRAERGYAGWQVSSGFSLRRGSWWGGGFVRHRNLAGVVYRDSPLVQRSQSWILGAAFAYILHASDELTDAN